MYKAYYGFKQHPFGKDIPCDDLFMYRDFKEFQQRIEFLKIHGGVGVLWGEPGTGKSVGLRWLRSSLNRNRYRFYYLPEPPMTLSDFYRRLALIMNIDPAYRRVDVYQQLKDHIMELSGEKGITPIIALDETQMYHYLILQHVRFLLNFDIDSRNYAILLLCGQPKLGKRLKRKEYEPLAQRVTVRHRFSGLDRAEVDRYLHHRLAIAGVKHQLFEDEAVQYIYQVTKGNLRKTDTLAVQSLLLAAGLKKKSIDQPVVEKAVEENFWAWAVGPGAMRKFPLD